MIDLFGGAGSGESLTGWTQNGNQPVALSTTQKRSGNSSFKPANDGTKSSHIYRDFTSPLDPTKQYVLVGWVYVESYTSGNQEVSLRDVGTFTSKYTVQFGSSIPVGSWQPFFIKIPTNNTLVGSGFRLLIGAISTQVNTMYFDELRLCAVSAADYAAIGTTITGEAIDRLLPYVPPGINGVDGLYVRRYGRNLLPDKPDTLHANARVNGPYDMTLVATAASQSAEMIIPVLPNTLYRFRVTTSASSGNSIVVIRKSDGSVTYRSGSYASDSVVSFTTDSTTTEIYVRLSCDIAGTFTFKNWQLELGNAATPFQPREDSLIAFGGVELHANPTDGSEPDILR
ncbi:carbohydrate binding domain-containing protein, partial [Paenibacillus odorifer]|uniref:carbohydrate binding domain-containing protein n=1 Tax=Paenibacillus odorifer TaxID=189426 RepID=UPI00351AB6A8